MRQKIAAGNWKMNTNVEEGKTLFSSIADHSIPDDVTVIIGAPSIHLASLKSLDKKRVHIAAQNCHQEQKGAFTGEISAPMLSDLGIPYVILGHSERRQYFHENDALLASKVDAVLEQGLQVIFCCGEPLEIRKEGSQNSYVSKQLEQGLFHISASQIKSVVIAYEPIWAIGTGETASPEQAQDMHAHMRAILASKYGEETANNTSILYGGSVKPANAKAIFSQPDVDGGLVGGASLKPEMFTQIIDSF